MSLALIALLQNCRNFSHLILKGSDSYPFSHGASYHQQFIYISEECTVSALEHANSYA